MTDSGLQCPFCGKAFRNDDLYHLQLHIEEVHTEDSPFRVNEDQHTVGPSVSDHSPQHAPALDDDVDFVECPVPECGESVLLEEYSFHLDLHDFENIPDNESPSHHQHADNVMKNTANFSLLAEQSSSVRHSRTQAHPAARTNLYRHISTFQQQQQPTTATPPFKSARLGKKELGPYAFEERMPHWLEKRLIDGAKARLINQIGGDGRLIKKEVVENETPGAVPVLAQLSYADRTVREAWYCHPSTVHICHTRREGGFCGYRNMQMLISYIQGARAEGHPEFPGRTPTIPRLQELIEDAWDQGINDIARIQTGGIKRTRKWIGTPEVQAVFTLLQIDCTVRALSDSPETGESAWEKLLVFVENYFSGFTKDLESKVHKTYAPPIYLQHPGHSLTIVGFERRRNGSANLIVFDPMFRTSPGMHKLLGRDHVKSDRPEILEAYRRGAAKMQSHRDFELFMLTAPAPVFPT